MKNQLREWDRTEEAEYRLADIIARDATTVTLASLSYANLRRQVDELRRVLDTVAGTLDAIAETIDGKPYHIIKAAIRSQAKQARAALARVGEKVTE